MKKAVVILLASFSFSLFAEGTDHLQTLAAERKAAYEQKSAEEKSLLIQDVTEQKQAEEAYAQRTATQSLWEAAGYLMMTVGEIIAE